MTDPHYQQIRHIRAIALDHGLPDPIDQLDADQLRHYIIANHPDTALYLEVYASPICLTHDQLYVHLITPAGVEHHYDSDRLDKILRIAIRHIEHP